jgi:hypothetical protein
MQNFVRGTLIKENRKYMSEIEGVIYWLLGENYEFN